MIIELGSVTKQTLGFPTNLVESKTNPNPGPVQP